MDPDRNLESSLALAREIVRSQAEDGGGYDDVTLDLAEQFIALHEWITNGDRLPVVWQRDDEPLGPELPEPTVVALREWGARHDFRDSEAEDSFDRGIGNIQWALAVESAHERSGEPD